MTAFKNWHDAHQFAIQQARKLGVDHAVRAVTWYGESKFAVSIACRNDSDYARAEIVKPTDAL